MSKLVSKLSKRIMAAVLSVAMILPNMTVYASEISLPESQEEVTAVNGELNEEQSSLTSEEAEPDEGENETEPDEGSEDETLPEGDVADEVSNDGGEDSDDGEQIEEPEESEISEPSNTVSEDENEEPIMYSDVQEVPTGSHEITIKVDGTSGLTSHNLSGVELKITKEGGSAVTYYVGDDIVLEDGEYTVALGNNQSYTQTVTLALGETNLSVGEGNDNEITINYSGYNADGNVATWKLKGDSFVSNLSSSFSGWYKGLKLDKVKNDGGYLNVANGGLVKIPVNKKSAVTVTYYNREDYLAGKLEDLDFTSAGSTTYLYNSDEAGYVTITSSSKADIDTITVTDLELVTVPSTLDFTISDSTAKGYIASWDDCTGVTASQSNASIRQGKDVNMGGGGSITLNIPANCDIVVTCYYQAAATIGDGKTSKSIELETNAKDTPFTYYYRGNKVGTVSINASGTTYIKKIEITEPSAGVSATDIAADTPVDFTKLAGYSQGDSVNSVAEERITLTGASYNGQHGIQVSNNSTISFNLGENFKAEVDLLICKNYGSGNTNTTKIEAVSGDKALNVIQEKTDSNVESGAPIYTVLRAAGQVNINIADGGTAYIHEMKVRIVEDDRYVLNVAEAENGTANADKGKTAKAGETVTLTAEPDSGYALDKWTVTYKTTGEGGTESDATVEVTPDSGDDNVATFTMPAADVQIVPSFVEEAGDTYDINIAPAAGIENGTVTAGAKKKAAKDSTVKLSTVAVAVPATGYRFKEWKVTYKTASDNVEEVELTPEGDDYTFTMPEGNVTISAEFEEKPVEYFYSTFFTQLPESAYDATSKAIKADKIEGFEYKGAKLDYHGDQHGATAYQNLVMTLNLKKMTDITVTGCYYAIKDGGKPQIEAVDSENTPLQVTEGAKTSEGGNTYIVKNAEGAVTLTLTGGYEYIHSITVGYEKEYTISAAQYVENATVTIKEGKENADAGATVNLGEVADATVTNENYEITGWTVTYVEGGKTETVKVEKTDNDYTFTMPAADVTVTPIVGAKTTKYTCAVELKAGEEPLDAEDLDGTKIVFEDTTNSENTLSVTVTKENPENLNAIALNEGTYKVAVYNSKLYVEQPEKDFTVSADGLTCTINFDKNPKKWDFREAPFQAYYPNGNKCTWYNGLEITNVCVNNKEYAKLVSGSKIKIPVSEKCSITVTYYGGNDWLGAMVGNKAYTSSGTTTYEYTSTEPGIVEISASGQASVQTITIGAPVEYNVSLAKAEDVKNATITPVTNGVSKAAAGDTVNLKDVATVETIDEETYEHTGWTVTAADGETVKVTQDADGEYMFVMPAADVTVTPIIGEKGKKYNIALPATKVDHATVAAKENGVTEAKAGETVKLSEVATVEIDAADAATYEHTGWTVTYGEGTDAKTINVTKDGDDYTFTMPAADVTVTPLITKKAVNYPAWDFSSADFNTDTYDYTKHTSESTLDLRDC